MKLWDIIFKVLILIIGLVVVAFNAELYIFCKQQKVELSSVKDKQDMESEFNNNKFKYQQDQIDRINKDLVQAQQQIKEQKNALENQKDALLQEAKKRQFIANQSKSIQTSLVDIKAEADAISQDMKAWQKDYVAVLADLEKKMNDSQNETKDLETNLTALNIPELKENINSLKTEIEKMTHPVDNGLSVASPVPEKKIEREELISP